VINSQGVFGAGLFVTYTGIEKLVVDALEGNDTFFIASTPANVAVQVIGGLGSDTFNVGGGNNDQPITVVANSLDGHSGLVENTVSSNDPRYQAIFAESVAPRIGDADAAGVVILKSTDALRVFEDASTDASLILDTYQVVLTMAPEETVIVTAAPLPPSE